jgi:hypothetical protein
MCDARAVIPVLGHIAFEVHGRHLAELFGSFHLYAQCRTNQLASIRTKDVLGTVCKYFALSTFDVDQDGISFVLEIEDLVVEVYLARILLFCMLAKNRFQAEKREVCWHVRCVTSMY